MKIWYGRIIYLIFWLPMNLFRDEEYEKWKSERPITPGKTTYGYPGSKIIYVYHGEYARPPGSKIKIEVQQKIGKILNYLIWDLPQRPWTKKSILKKLKLRVFRELRG